MGGKKSKPEPSDSEQLLIDAQAEAEAEADKPRTNQQYVHGTIDVDCITDVFSLFQAEEAQRNFFNAFLEEVFQHAQPKSCKDGTVVLISTDMQTFELRVEGVTAFMVGLVDSFLKRVAREEGNPGTDRELDKQMQDLVKELSATSLCLWLRFKRIGVNNPSADFGYTVEGALDWIIADLLMPAVKDQTIFREHAEQELTAPSHFSSSLFPIEPERLLGLCMTGPPKKALLCGLFFFKSLGFVKPDDATVRVLGSSPATSILLRVAMGPKGLTRIMLRLNGPKKEMGPELAWSLMFPYMAENIAQITKRIGADYNILIYGAESKGYTVTLGFTA